MRRLYNGSKAVVCAARACLCSSPMHPQADCIFRRAALYPERFAGDGNDGEAEAPMVRFADVGCGFGGLLIRLSPLYPDKLMVGFELRDKARRRWPRCAADTLSNGQR